MWRWPSLQLLSQLLGKLKLWSRAGRPYDTRPDGRLGVRPGP